jgi:signal transduction histidine kinase
VTILDSGTGPDSAPRLFGRLLNFAGIVVLATLLLLQSPLSQRPAWVGALAGLALLGWFVRELVPTASPWFVVSCLVSLAAASVVTTSTSVLGYVAGIICLASLVASPRWPIALGLIAAGASAIVVGAGALLLRADLPTVLGAYVGLVVAVLVGVSRRQSRTGVERERALLEERARTAALAERSRIARDIHDVLAHSLGGLVLQLDAIDALLDSGKVSEAHGRVTAARGLAATGLDEARRAVDALRDPETSDDLVGAIEQLVITHRSVGSEATLSTKGTPVALSSDSAGALRRAAQEVLSNARRHAPGTTTQLALEWSPDAAALTAATPVVAGTPPQSPGGGRGLAGLRERVEAVGGTADWGVRDGEFVVTARVPQGLEVHS